MKKVLYDFTGLQKCDYTNSYIQAYIFLSSEESDTFSINLTQRQKYELQCCNFLDSYNLYIYSFNDLFIPLLFIHLTKHIIYNIKHLI